MNAADNPGSDLPVVPQLVAGPAPNARVIQPVGPTSLAVGADHALEGQSGIAVGDWWRAFRRKWRIALPLGLVGAAIAGALTWQFMPRPQYTATAVLRVQEEVPRVIFPTAEPQTRFETFQKTQKTLITSRFVLENVLKDPSATGLASMPRATTPSDDPVEWLQKQVTVDFPPGSEILQISVSGPNAGDVAVLANTITDTYMKLIVDEARAERNKRYDRLRELWTSYQAKMKEKRDRLRRLALKAGSDNRAILVTKSQLAYQQLAMIQQEKLRVKAEKIRLRAEAEAERDFKTGEMLRAMDLGGPNPDEAAIAEAVERDPKVEHLHESLRALLRRYDSYRRLVKKPNDPSLTNVRKQIEDVSRELESTRKEALLHAHRAEQGPNGRTAASSALRTSERVQILEKFEKELETEELALQDGLKESNEDTLDLEDEKEAIALTDASAKRVGAEVEALEVELQAPPRIKVIDHARTPTALNNKKVVQATGLASIAVLGSILFGFSFLEVRARRINSMDQVVHGLGLRVVGSLPAPSRAPRRRLVGPRGKHQDWNRLVIESIDAIRATLLYASRVQGLRVVMVTSAQPGEGKTTLASHLATSLARAGRKTVLIDCDFRKPALQQLFDLPVTSGLAEVLKGDAGLAEAIHPSPANNLSLLPAGEADPLAMEALGRGDLQGYIDDLKSQFDFLIIDSAPVLPVADSLLISQHVDAVIFSILHDVSRIPTVQAAYNRLAGLGVRILGAVVAGTQPQEHYGVSCNYYDADAKQDAARTS